MEIAYKSLCNNFGIIIDEIINDVDDYVVFRYTDDKKTRKAKIYYTNSGRTYFRTSVGRQYLDEFMRSDI